MDTERQIMRGNGEGLVEFLVRTGERGDLNRSTAAAFRAAARKILAVESADLKAVDLRSLDVDDLLERFANLHKADFSEGSLDTYRSRFRRGLAMYIGWLDDDPNWKTAGLTAAGAKWAAGQATRRPTARRQSTPAPQASAREPTDSAEAATADEHPSAPNAGVRVMTYDVPLRPDLVARVTLPYDLTPEDAERFAAFIRVLAFSPNQSGSGNKTSQGGA